MLVFVGPFNKFFFFKWSSSVINHSVNIVFISGTFVIIFSNAVFVMVMMVIVVVATIRMTFRRGVVRMMVVWKHGVPTQQQIDRQQQETDDLTLFHGRKNTKKSATQAFARITDC